MIKVDTGMGLIFVFVPRNGTVNEVCEALEAIGNEQCIFGVLGSEEGTDTPVPTIESVEEYFRGRQIDTIMVEREYQLGRSELIADAIYDGEVVTPLFIVD
jgi:hypothetical protein